MLTAYAPEPALFLWSGVLIVAVVVGYLLVVWVRRRMREVDEPAAPPFSLAELRELQRAGKLSQEEYERARASIVDAMLRQSQKKSGEESGRGP